MKRLGLLRHAKSDWDDISLRDFDRGLNDRGRKGAALMGAHIRQQDADWKLILASPAERVKRTLDASGLKIPVQFEQDIYLGSCGTLLGHLKAIDDELDAVLLVGHNPGLQELALALVPPDGENALFDELMDKYPTASYAQFELDIESWSELAEGCGSLVYFVRPRDLDPALGPQISN